MDNRAQLADKLARIGQPFEAVTGALHVVGDDGLLHLVTSFGLPDPLRSIVQTIPVGKGIAGVAAQRRQPVTLCNLQTDDSGVTRPGAKLTGVEGAIAVPILDGDQLIGVLGIGKAQPHDYSAAEIQALTEAGLSLLPDLPSV